jgi:hypothetical protein
MHTQTIPEDEDDYNFKQRCDKYFRDKRKRKELNRSSISKDDTIPYNPSVKDLLMKEESKTEIISVKDVLSPSSSNGNININKVILSVHQNQNQTLDVPRSTTPFVQSLPRSALDFEHEEDTVTKPIFNNEAP